MANFLKEHQDAFYGGGIAVLFGFLSKSVARKEILPVSNGQQIFLTFFTVSIAAIAGNEFRKEVLEL